MKKLIMAFAAIAMASVASAATVKWTGANIYQPGSTTDKAAGYLVYFVSSADYGLASAQADLAAQKTDFITKHGQASAVTANGAATATITTTAGNSESWTGYLVILNAGTLADATSAYLTGETTKSTGGAGQAATLAFTANTGTQTASNWYTVAAPEPTSGLLLLLGVAGLALKRKRA